MRALSGVNATGAITLGNYIGAVRLWVENQEKYDENFYFIPDLHSLNVRPSSDELNKSIYDAAAILLAAGIDPKKSVVFTQSSISAHSELFNILNNYVTMGELNRMVQFKEKQQKYGKTGLVAGFFEYPVLMAADILLYDVDEVPVGEDQVQHVELARDIANRFNNVYGQTFKPPKAVFPKVGARIMDLQDPTKKMSKSDDDSSGCVYIEDPADVVERKFIRAVTDSGSEIKAGKTKPALTNLLNIYSSLSGKSVGEIEKQYHGKGYADFKKDLAVLTISVLKPLQAKYKELMANKKGLEKILRDGKDRAQPIAKKKLSEIKQKIGLLTD